MKRVEAIVLNKGTADACRFRWDQSPWVAHRTMSRLIEEGTFGPDQLQLLTRLPFRVMPSGDFASLADLAEVVGTTVEDAVEVLELMSTQGIICWSDAQQAMEFRMTDEERRVFDQALAEKLGPAITAAISDRARDAAGKYVS